MLNVFYFILSVSLKTRSDTYLFLFFKEVGAYAAQRALIIFGELFALVDITADSTNKLFHAVSPSL